MSTASPSTANRLPLFLGYFLLWGGFLVAAFCSVVRTEQPDKWSTIPWTPYVIAWVVGIAGVVLIRWSKSHDAMDEVKTEAEYSVVRRSLDIVASVVDRLCSSPVRNPIEVARCIDDECVEPLSDFADARQALVKRFGLTTFADVMTEFASAERLINRSWSAAVDGYVDEVDSSLRQAREHLLTARTLLDAAESRRG